MDISDRQEPSKSETDGEIAPLPQVSIEADVATRITFATHQCAVPLLRDLVIRNPTEGQLEGLTLSLTAEPEIIGSKTWTIDRLAPGSELRLHDRDVSLKGGLLDELNESLLATVRLELIHQGDVVASSAHDVRALARNEWGGANHMPELLAAFVMPNDNAVQRLLKSTSHLLEQQGKSPSLEGYQSKSRARIWELTAAVWAAVSARQLTYANPPASFEREGQKVRSPSDMEDQGLATCLDTALIFAAALEQIGLNTVIAFTQGHAFAGVWLQPQTLSQLTTDDPMELRKAVAAKELVLFETTLVAGSTPPPFSKAIREADRQIAEDREQEFVYAIDIKQARTRQIGPLPSKGTTADADASAYGASASIIPAIEGPPDDLPGFDFGLETAPPPDTAEGRLDNWKRKLLDLSKRNRLLNLRPSKTAIQIFCPDPAKLEDKLADDKSMTFITPPIRERRDGAPDDQIMLLRTGDDFSEEFALDALNNEQVVAQTNEKDLQAGLIGLYRKAKLDLQEGGANTLFLALGMLRWTPAGDKRQYRAPLILLPVKLDRSSALSKVKLSHHEDDSVFNLTLLELLRQEFQVSIPELAGDLPQDHSGIDVPSIWQTVRQRVRDIPGFEVVPEVVLSTFSFAKYLMWKDLSDRTEALKQSPFVRHMIDTPRDPYGNSASFLDPTEIDQEIQPGDLFMPLNADSSQIVAVHASAQDGDFVLEGPPGTGKSETIGNIIAHNLALGRRVLFVSEKMAALEVVYRRLQSKGLGDFCLELHSNKANKKDVIAQLDRAWDERLKRTASEWQHTADELKLARDRLNGLVAALHKPGPTGLSPRQALARAVRFKEFHRVRLDWGQDLQRDDRAKSSEGLEALLRLAHDLGRQFKELEKADLEYFEEIDHEEWSFAWQDQVLSEAKAVVVAAEDIEQVTAVFLDRMGIELSARTKGAFAALEDLVDQLSAAHAQDLGFGLSPDAPTTFEALEDALKELESYRQAREELSQPFSDAAIRSAPVSEWTEQWNLASDRIWPLRLFGQSGVRKKIAQHFGFGKSGIKPDTDLPTLKKLQRTAERMDKASEQLPTDAPWQGLSTDIGKVRTAAEAAKRLRRSMITLAGFNTDIADLRPIFRKRFVEGREMLEPGMPISEAGQSFLSSLSEFTRCANAFRQSIGMAVVQPDPVEQTEADWSLDQLVRVAEAVLERAVRLNPWCQWVELRRKAEAEALEPLVTGLIAGGVDPDQARETALTAYCVWLAPKLIDARNELRTFSGSSQEETITTFRKLDQELAEMTSSYIRARLSGQVPERDKIGKDAGFSFLRRELAKKRHFPVRKIINESSDALLTLTPCLLMSPLSVAQYLSAETPAFDLVVFDEASQITVWDAIGAIARGKRTVIVGDPKQMPPTNFFEKGAVTSDDSDDDDSGFGGDLESILDEAMAASVKHWRLTGHYRSRHESLIAFSNYAYYNSQLVTYPSAETRDTVVAIRKVDGIYGKGKDRTNPIEAKATVEEILRRLRDPDLSKFSIGVVTLNSEQQRLILDLLDAERRTDESLEPFFRDDNEEPVFVKNLETVQGDQRDVILISIGYGPTEPGAQTMSMNFGPLNRQGGERRLNVAITRATSEVVVFSSFDPSMIDLSRTQSVAVRHLKHYLDFAARGTLALGEAIQSVGGTDTYDSDFEFVVAEGLRRHGWTVHTQVGVSKFRIDLGIVHPEEPGRYLAGVECDGATYHSLPCARDRDRVRHAILERLNWKLVRIWSTDFFLDPRHTLERVNARLQELLDQDRAEAERRAFEQEEAQKVAGMAGDVILREGQSSFDASAQSPSLPDEIDDVETADQSEEHSIELEEELSTQSGETSGLTVAQPNKDGENLRPQAPDLFQEAPPAKSTSDLKLNPDIFYEDSYLKTIAALGCEVIDSEGPITFKLLSERIARRHGYQRTGREIKRVVWRAVQRKRRYTAAPDGQKIFWPKNTEPCSHLPFRGLEVNGQPRGWNDVPYPEKLGLVKSVLSTAHPAADIPALCASRIGLGRLRARTRAELEALVEEARSN